MTATAYIEAIKARGCRVEVGQITGRQMYLTLRSHAKTDLDVAGRVASEASLETDRVDDNYLIVTGFTKED